MIVDKNFIKDFQAEDVEKFFLNQSFNWTMSAYSGINEDALSYINGPSFAKEEFHFGSMLFDGFNSKDGYDVAYTLLKLFCEKHDIQVRAVIRSRVSVMSRGISKLPSPPHVDMHYDHKVFLYYVNDSDGETVFYNELFDKNKKPECLTEMIRISPEKGKAVVFDGNRYHSASYPQEGLYRMIINIDFI